MANTPENTNLDNWHRYFAVVCNNRGWELLESERDAAQDREMLDAAHAAAWHWRVAGGPHNNMLATLLLAEVHALLGLGQTAYAYAQQVREYIVDRDSSDWEVALTHAIHAHAALAAGQIDAYRGSYQKAASALDAIADEEEREIVGRTFAQVPPPGARAT